MVKLLTGILGMLIFITVLIAGCGGGNSPTTNNTVQLPPPDKILIAYYSQTGHNAAVAKEIQKQIGGDLFQIKTDRVYPKNVPGTLTQVKREYVEQIRPNLTTRVDNFDKYEFVVLGYPNWYDDPPMGVLRFLEDYQWKGKVIAPFVSYGLSGYGTSIASIKKAAPEATVVHSMAIHAGKTKDSGQEVEKWLKMLTGKRGDTRK